MKIAVFGLGYVGCVSAAGFASRGHHVIGVDTNPLKVGLLAGGTSPILEAGVDDLVADSVRAGLLTATDDAAGAVRASDISLICVGTPSAPHGGLSTAGLERVARTIGEALVDHQRRHTVVVRSTMLPGTCDTLIVPILEQASGLRAGRDFGIAVNPEFLREGTSVDDFGNPPKTVIGEIDEASGEAVAALYEDMPAPLFRVPLRVAELEKYIDNAFHALKIGFANEVGSLCRLLDIDSHEVMRIFRSDTKLNISPAYLTPGFAFGGSCLPKDLRALLYCARHVDLEMPILESVMPSNERHIRRLVERVIDLGLRRIGLFGLAFKPGTDDLRESPLVELAERLLGKGFDLRIYDPSVSLARLVGGNREYIESRIPHLSALLVGTPEEVIEHAEVCIVGSAIPEAIEAIEAVGDRPLIDLVRLPDASERRVSPEYSGVAW